MAEESLPVSDDVQATDQGQTEQDLLDAVMRQSHLLWMRLPHRYPKRRHLRPTRLNQ